MDTPELKDVLDKFPTDTTPFVVVDGKEYSIDAVHLQGGKILIETN